MNILVIGTTDIVGGAAQISWYIKHFLEKQGHHVSMFVADKRSTDPNVKVIKRVFWRKLLGFIFSTEDLIDTDWLLETPEFKSADVIHAHNLHGRFFNLNTLRKMSEKKPVVWTLHDEWAITPHCACTMESRVLKNGLYTCPSISTPPRLLWPNNRYLAWRKRKIYSKLHCVLVSPSKWLINRLSNTVLSDKPVRLIYNGIDLDVFKPINKIEARKQLNLPLDKKIVLFLAGGGADNPWKGWTYTEQVLNNYRNRDDILFLCVGNLEDKHRGKNVQFAGYVSDKKVISKYYSAADILLFTSVAENFPLVVLEAMRCGLVVVSFDVGGVKEAVSHGETGYVAKYRDLDDLKKYVDRALSLEDGERLRLSDAARKCVEDKFSVTRMISEYECLYKSIITSTKK